MWCTYERCVTRTPVALLCRLFFGVDNLRHLHTETTVGTYRLRRCSRVVVHPYIHRQSVKAKHQVQEADASTHNKIRVKAPALVACITVDTRCMNIFEPQVLQSKHALVSSSIKET